MLEFDEQLLINKTEDLVSIGKSINTIYKKLQYLEMKNMQNSPQFQKYVEILRSLRHAEDEYVKTIRNKEMDSAYIMYYLTKKYHLEGINAYYDHMYLTDRLKIVNRIITNIENYFNTNNIFIRKDNVLSVVQDNFDVDLFEDSYYQAQLTVDRTYTYQHLKNMDKLLQERPDLGCAPVHEHKDIRELYLEFKYNLSFIDKRVEKFFLYNNFSVQDLPIPTFKQQAHLLGLSFEEFSEAHDFCLVEIVRNHLLEYLDFANNTELEEADYERRFLTLWYLSNIFKEVNIQQLLQLITQAVGAPYFDYVDEKEKNNIFELLDKTFNFKPFDAEKGKVYTKEK